MEKPIDIVFQHGCDSTKIKAVTIAGKSLMRSNKMSDVSEQIDDLFADKFSKFCERRGLNVQHVDHN